MRSRADLRIPLAVALSVCGTSLGAIAPSGQKAKVDLVSSVEAVAPGQPFDVGLHFQLAEGWRIYWRDSGDSGQPPHVKWTLPDGFTAAELQFPVPKRHHTGVGARRSLTNVLEGEAVLLVRMTPPETIAENRVTIAGEVVSFVCKEDCLLETVFVKLELPVLPVGGEVKPANKELFRRARAALPSQHSKYISITPGISSTGLQPGQAFELTLAVAVAPGYHILSHEPTQPTFVRCDTFLERVDGIRFGEPVYSPATTRVLPYLGKLSEYTGRFVVRIPAEVDKAASHGPVDFGGFVAYQACNDKGTCFPPHALVFSLTGVASIETIAAPVAKAGNEPPDSVGAAPALVAEMDNEAAKSAAAEERQVTERTSDASAHGDDAHAFAGRFGLLRLLIACFIYGLVLNATPCVLPVLSIKILGFVQQAHESRGRTLMLGLSFGIGVVLFFVILGLLASAGKNVLQYPVVVIAFSTVVMALALSMLGVYTLQVPTAAAKLEERIQREGMLSSFGKGALAPVLGFACTGPLLAGAFAWATQQPPQIAIVAFLFAGLGMASPYILLGANPNWLSFLPRPGPWMITFERIMGFLLLAMVVWLLHPLVTQMGPEGLECTLGFLVAIGMACWVLGKIDMSMSAPVRRRYGAGAAAIAVGAGVLTYGWIYPQTKPTYELPWQTWSPEAVERAVFSGKTVFVDFTAAYCTTCKLNKRRAINTPEVYRKVQEWGVVAFQGDFTSGDPEIAAVLRKHGRVGVPLNLIYPAGKPDDPILLPVMLTPGYLLQKLDEAGPSREAPPAPAPPSG